MTSYSSRANDVRRRDLSVKPLAQERAYDPAEVVLVVNVSPWIELPLQQVVTRQIRLVAEKKVDLSGFGGFTTGSTQAVPRST